MAGKETSTILQVADHPTRRADIVIGTEADWGEYNYIDNGVLGGFDIELTKAVCKHAGKVCAIVTVPWQSVWAAKYAELGWPKGNPKIYPGIGTNNAWFHCTSGTRNTVGRQQSTAFTDPYTDKTRDHAGFVVRKDAVIGARAAGKRVAILEGQAYTDFFRANSGASSTKKFNPSELKVEGYMRDVWALLEAGKVDAVYTASSEATLFLEAGSHGANFSERFFGPAGSEGVGYMCRPEFGDVVQALNQGLRKFKQTAEYKALCDRYQTIYCDTRRSKWSNAKIGENLQVADHPTTRADIVIGTEADWGEYNYIDNGVLGGFDIELTKAVCKHAGKVCAIVTVPWQSVWAAKYAELGWPKGNPKIYPGIGTNNAWFHCTSGTRNTVGRQQSTAFTDPYTDKTRDHAGFVVRKDAVIGARAAGKRVAILEGQAYTDFFRANSGASSTKKFNPSELKVEGYMRDVWALLEAGKVDAVYTASSEATLFLEAGSHGANFSERFFGPAGSEGVGYMCRPEFGDVVQALNQGLRKFKQTAEYKALCDRYATIHCNVEDVLEPLHLALLIPVCCLHFISSCNAASDFFFCRLRAHGRAGVGLLGPLCSLQKRSMPTRLFSPGTCSRLTGLTLDAVPRRDW